MKLKLLLLVIFLRYEERILDCFGVARSEYRHQCVVLDDGARAECGD